MPGRGHRASYILILFCLAAVLVVPHFHDHGVGTDGLHAHGGELLSGLAHGLDHAEEHLHATHHQYGERAHSAHYAHHGQPPAHHLEHGHHGDHTHPHHGRHDQHTKPTTPDPANLWSLGARHGQPLAHAHEHGHHQHLHFHTKLLPLPRKVDLPLAQLTCAQFAPLVLPALFQLKVSNPPGDLTWEPPLKFLELTLELLNLPPPLAV